MPKFKPLWIANAVPLTVVSDFLSFCLEALYLDYLLKKKKKINVAC